MFNVQLHALLLVYGDYNMNYVRGIIVAMLALLPAILFWTIPLVTSFFSSCLDKNEDVIGGSRLPSIVTFLGCYYSPNKIGVTLLVGLLIVYIAVVVWWIHLAEVN